MIAVVEQVALRQPDNVTIAQRHTVVIPLQERWDKGSRLKIVFIAEGRTTSREKSHTATTRIQEQLLTSRYQQRIVVFGELTSGSIDKRHLVIIGERDNVGIGEHVLARQTLDTTVTIV